jgi:hypothetical protein
MDIIKDVMEIPVDLPERSLPVVNPDILPITPIAMLLQVYLVKVVQEIRVLVDITTPVVAAVVVVDTMAAVAVVPVVVAVEAIMQVPLGQVMLLIISELIPVMAK